MSASLPYALTPPNFRFHHLAQFAGSAPIGGAREVALATFVVARLAADGGVDVDDPAVRVARCNGAKAWLGVLALPAPIRGSLTRCVDLASAGAGASLSGEVAALAQMVGSYVDAASINELVALAQSIPK